MHQPTPVAIVTGASRGLGEVIARILAERRHDVVLNARGIDPLRRVAAEVSASGSLVAAVDGDVTDPATRERLVAAARQLGGLNLLVNNASELGGIGPLSTFDVTRFGRVFPVNVGAPLALIQLALPLLAERGGLIVNVTSDAAQGAYPGWGPYGASKAALELLTRTLAAELQPSGVAALLVDPGDMRTQMHQDAYPNQDISDRPMPHVTVPFWNWLFDQDSQSLSGQRLVAQQEDSRWLQAV